MPRTLIALLGLGLASLGGRGTAADAETKEQPLAFTGVTVVDVDRGALVPGQTVVVEGGRIKAVGPAGKVAVPAGARAVDGSGKFLIPGLWDMHTHVAGPAYLPLFVANGVTGVREMHAFVPSSVLAMRREVRDGKRLGPRIVTAGALVDGPRAFWPGAIKVANAAEGRAAVRKLQKMGADFVKVYEGLPRDAYFAIVDEARKHKLSFAGHVPASVSAEEASDAGQKSIEHLTGIALACARDEAALRKELAEARNRPGRPDPALSARVFGRVLDGFDEARARALFAKFVRNGTWQVPTLVVLRATSSLDDKAITGDPRIKYMPPYMRLFWDSYPKPPKEWRALQKHMYRNNRNLVKAMHRARVPILAGTDCSNPYVFPGFSLHDELGLLVEVGLSPAEALRAATLNPAKFLGEDKTAGTIAVGKRADLVLLDADPLADIGNTRKVRAVVVNGRYLPRAELRKLLADAEKEAGGK